MPSSVKKSHCHSFVCLSLLLLNLPYWIKETNQKLTKFNDFIFQTPLHDQRIMLYHADIEPYKLDIIITELDY